MDSTFFRQKFEHGQSYQQHIATGNEAQRERWRQMDSAARLSPQQAELIGTFTRQMHILIISGVWCGDCIEQIPLIARIAEANPGKIDLRIVDRDEHADLSSQFRINGGARVPVVLLLSEDFELCAIAGDRTLARYRAIAARKLGPTCSTSIVLPPEEERAATLADWLNEIERVQLMLRLSPRLREKHGD